MGEYKGDEDDDHTGSEVGTDSENEDRMNMANEIKKASEGKIKEAG